MNMNPYALIGATLGVAGTEPLLRRIAEWHDAMVAHERRLRGRLGDECDDACAHGQARALWSEAVTTFGDRAHELSFLRSRAIGAIPPSEDIAVSANAEAGRASDDGRENQRARQTGAPRQRPFLRRPADKITEESRGV